MAGIGSSQFVMKRAAVEGMCGGVRSAACAKSVGFIQMLEAVAKPDAPNDDGPGSLHNHRVANKGRGIVGKRSI